MIPKTEFLEKMRTAHIFNGLTDEVISAIYDKGKVITIPNNHVLFKEAEMSPYMYVIFKGELNIFLPQGDKRFSEIHLNALGPGAIIGEYSFVDAKPSSASVISSQESVLFEIKKSAFLSVIEQSQVSTQTVYKNLLRLLVQRCRECNAELDVFTSL